METRPLDHRDDARRGVLVRALRPDRLALCDRELESGCRDPDDLAAPADEVHLDPRMLLVPDRAMRELVENEIAAQLAIDPDEKIQVERSGHAQRVVIRRQQLALVLHEIGADEEA